jgi:hypothetical protein
MYAERLAKIRWLPYRVLESQERLRLSAKSDRVVVVRVVMVMAVVAIFVGLVGPWFAWINARLGLLLWLLVACVWGGLVASGVSFAKWVRAPTYTKVYCRVRKSLEIGLLGQRPGQRRDAVMLDGQGFEAANVRDVAVVAVVETDSTRDHAGLRAVMAFADAEDMPARASVRFLATMVVGSVAYEFGRSTVLAEASALASVVASALAGEERSARVIEVRVPWPKAVLTSVALRVFSIVVVAYGLALAHASHVACAIAVAGLLAVDLVCTEWDGWTFGRARGALVDGWLTALARARVDAAREGGPSGYREGARTKEGAAVLSQWPVDGGPPTGIGRGHTMRRWQVGLLLLALIVGGAVLGPEAVRLTRLFLGAGP